MLWIQIWPPTKSRDPAPSSKLANVCTAPIGTRSDGLPRADHWPPSQRAMFCTVVPPAEVNRPPA
jgi:hypothetical protein